MDNNKKRKSDEELTSSKKPRPTQIFDSSNFGEIENFRQKSIEESFGGRLVINKRNTITQPKLTWKKPVPKYQLSLEQVRNGQFGIEALQNSNSYSKSDLTKQWRMKATNQGYGGHGMDELQRTSYATKELSVVSSSLSKKELRWEAFLLSMDRVDTASLVWFTSSNEIGGHPGALRSPKQVDSGKGTTNTGHNSRDSARVKALLSEPNDFSRFARAKIETIRTMSTPFEEFEHNRKNGFTTDLTHAVGGDLSQFGAFQKMSSYVGDNREFLKWDTASLLRTMNLDEHVPPVMGEYLKKNDNIPRLALLEWHKDLGNSSLKLEVNKTTSSQADVLGEDETLSGTVSKVSKGSRPRALSNPRKMQDPKKFDRF